MKEGTPMSVVEETHAIQEIYMLIKPFSSKERTRILDWLVAKLEEDRDIEAIQVGGPP